MTTAARRIFSRPTRVALQCLLGVGGTVVLGALFWQGLTASGVPDPTAAHLDPAAVLEGVLIGLAFTGVVGALTFFGHHKLPYKQMLVLTGVLLALVLVVMVGKSVQELQLAGWLGTTPVPLPIPAWCGVWFALFANVEGLVAQAGVALLVFGSYGAARYLRVWRPLCRGETSALRREQAPF